MDRSGGRSRCWRVILGAAVVALAGALGCGGGGDPAQTDDSVTTDDTETTDDTGRPDETTTTDGGTDTRPTTTAPPEPSP